MCVQVPCVYLLYAASTVTKRNRGLTYFHGVSDLWISFPESDNPLNKFLRVWYFSKKISWWIRPQGTDFEFEYICKLETKPKIKLVYDSRAHMVLIHEKKAKSLVLLTLLEGVHYKLELRFFFNCTRFFTAVNRYLRAHLL